MDGFLERKSSLLLTGRKGEWSGIKFDDAILEQPWKYKELNV